MWSKQVRLRNEDFEIQALELESRKAVAVWRTHSWLRTSLVLRSLSTPRLLDLLVRSELEAASGSSWSYSARNAARFDLTTGLVRPVEQSERTDELR